MRITGIFELDRIDRITLHEYSMILYAEAMRDIDRRAEAAYSALYNLVPSGLNKNEVSENDIFDQDEALLTLFGRDIMDSIPESKKEAADFIFELNQRLEGR